MISEAALARVSHEHVTEGNSSDPDKTETAEDGSARAKVQKLQERILQLENKIKILQEDAESSGSERRFKPKMNGRKT